MGKTFFSSPIGIIEIIDNGKAVTNITLLNKVDKNSSTDYQKHNPSELGKATAFQLEEYFSGKRKIFDIPLEPKGTDFQKRVWNALRQIPYGETRSYKEIAIAAGSPKGYRAVGMANNKNPLLIVVPCHRVIGANGNLVGFGAGIENKVFLLDLEKKNP